MNQHSLISSAAAATEQVVLPGSPMAPPDFDGQIDRAPQDMRGLGWGRRWALAGWGLPIVLASVSGLLQGFCGTDAWLTSWPGLVVAVFAAVTAATDSIWKKIPNWMAYPTALTGLLIGIWVSVNGPSAWSGNLDLASASAGFAVCFVCMLVPYRMSGQGAGDVKLAAAYGALLGWRGGLSVIITAYMIAGAALVVVHLTSSHPGLLPKALLRLLGSTWMPKVIEAPDDRQRQVLSRPVPLGGAFAVALIIVLCGGNLFPA